MGDQQRIHLSKVKQMDPWNLESVSTHRIPSQNKGPCLEAHPSQEETGKGPKSLLSKPPQGPVGPGSGQREAVSSRRKLFEWPQTTKTFQLPSIRF